MASHWNLRRNYNIHYCSYYVFKVHFRRKNSSPKQKFVECWRYTLMIHWSRLLLSKHALYIAEIRIVLFFLVFSSDDRLECDYKSNTFLPRYLIRLVKVWQEQYKPPHKLLKTLFTLESRFFHFTTPLSKKNCLVFLDLPNYFFELFQRLKQNFRSNFHLLLGKSKPGCLKINSTRIALRFVIKF